MARLQELPYTQGTIVKLLLNLGRTKQTVSLKYDKMLV
jgi:hypothetical protein